jgi:ABC-type branched-subunit amino acid transport system ATPase component
MVEEKIEELDLGEFANKAAGSLSGGNQRKLSVAIAMMGSPPVLFLDGGCQCGARRGRGMRGSGWAVWRGA